MAKTIHTTVELTDDIDGGKADQTISFSYNGTQYEIDLSKKNAVSLGKALKPYVDSARKVRASHQRATAPKSAKRTDLADIRAWASQNGYELSDRGRIPSSVVEAYDAR